MSDIPDRAELRRDQILAAAERIFASKGYHAAGIADIAAELGIGHGTFYRYFKNKQDIVQHVLDRAANQFTEVGLRENPEGSDTVDEYQAQVERMISGWLALAETHRPLIRLFHEQWSSVDLPRLLALRDLYVDYTERFLRNGVSKGFLRPDLDVGITAQMLTALVFEGSRRALETDDPAERVRWKDAGMMLMFDGIRAR